MGKVVLSGYYGFDNLGDEAILQGLATGLKDKGHEVTVLSYNPGHTSTTYGLQAHSRMVGALGAIMRADAFISGGGGLLQDKTSFRSLQYYLGLIRLARTLGKKVIIYGQSIGPLSKRGYKEVSKTLKGLPIAIRDNASQDLLRSMGFQSTLVADAALLLPPPSISPPTIDVLLIPRGHYPDLQEGLYTLAHDLLERGFKVGVSMVQPSEDVADLEALLGLGCIDCPASTVPELLEVITQSRYVVSGRLHGLILASLAGVNFCGLVYDPKVKAFLQEMQAPAFELPVHRTQLLETVLEQPHIFQEYHQAMRQRALDGLDWLHKQLS
jgi:polysaccharide pyruvyl transferase CsaB